MPGPRDPALARAVTLDHDGATGPARLPWVRTRLLVAVGPAFVAGVAYIDPGNFATNFQGGAKYGYELIWSIVLASLAATLVQYLTSKTGLVTGHSLPELCRTRFSRPVNWLLWIQAEIVAMATDLAEFVGAAVGLHLIFGMPLLAAGGVTAVAAFGILALEHGRRRQFVAAIAALFFVVVGAFGYLLIQLGGQRWGDLSRGLVPHVHSSGELTLVVGIVGATVMPHVIYAHSALQTHHIQTSDPREKRRRLRLNAWDCVIALGIAGAVNVAMLCVAAVLPKSTGGSTGDLAAVYALLRDAGGGCGLVFGIALVASGFASSTVGTYAGQVVMSGFVQRRIPVVARRAITMVPSLIILATSVEPTSALVVSQVILSFCIPFALVPLVLISRDRAIMHEVANRRVTNVLAVVITVVITGLNLSLVYGALT